MYYFKNKSECHTKLLTAIAIKMAITAHREIPAANANACKHKQKWNHQAYNCVLNIPKDLGIVQAYGTHVSPL